MAQTKPAPLCNHLMPSGKLCRGVALRGEHYCRFHASGNRLLDRQRAEFAALERLDAQIQRMDLPTLLNTVKVSLVTLNRSQKISRLHELCHLISIAEDRLENALSSSESNTIPQLTPDQIPEDLSHLSPSEINQLILSLGSSIT